jgi:hypothetical protein
VIRAQGVDHEQQDVGPADGLAVRGASAGGDQQEREEGGGASVERALSTAGMIAADDLVAPRGSGAPVRGAPLPGKDMAVVVGWFVDDLR